MDRRDDFGNRQDTGGQGDQWGYGGPGRHETDEEPTRPARSGYSSLADLNERRRPGPPELPVQRGPRSGEPLPPIAPTPDPFLAEPAPGLHEPTSMIDSAAVRRSIAETDGLYRSKRPIFAALFGFLAVVGELLMLRPFLAGLFVKTTAEALAPLLALVAFPLLALGLYGLFTGAATAVQFQGPRVWLRTPLVYLPIALLLLIAAGAAA